MKYKSDSRVLNLIASRNKIYIDNTSNITECKLISNFFINKIINYLIDIQFIESNKVFKLTLFGNEYHKIIIVHNIMKFNNNNPEFKFIL